MITTNGNTISCKKSPASKSHSGVEVVNRLSATTHRPVKNPVSTSVVCMPKISGTASRNAVLSHDVSTGGPGIEMLKVKQQKFFTKATVSSLRRKLKNIGLESDKVLSKEAEVAMKRFERRTNHRQRALKAGGRESAWIRDLTAEGVEPNPGPKAVKRTNSFDPCRDAINFDIWLALADAPLLVTPHSSGFMVRRMNDGQEEAVEVSAPVFLAVTKLTTPDVVTHCRAVGQSDTATDLGVLLRNRRQVLNDDRVLTVMDTCRMSNRARSKLGKTPLSEIRLPHISLRSDLRRRLFDQLFPPKSQWVRDLTIEGVEPNPGPKIYAQCKTAKCDISEHYHKKLKSSSSTNVTTSKKPELSGAAKRVAEKKKSTTPVTERKDLLLCHTAACPRPDDVHYHSVHNDQQQLDLGSLAGLPAEIAAAQAEAFNDLPLQGLVDEFKEKTPKKKVYRPKPMVFTFSPKAVQQNQPPVALKVADRPSPPAKPKAVTPRATLRKVVRPSSAPAKPPPKPDLSQPPARSGLAPLLTDPRKVDLKVSLELCQNMPQYDFGEVFRAPVKFLYDGLRHPDNYRLVAPMLITAAELEDVVLSMPKNKGYAVTAIVAGARKAGSDELVSGDLSLERPILVTLDKAVQPKLLKINIPPSPKARAVKVPNSPKAKPASPPNSVASSSSNSTSSTSPTSSASDASDASAHDPDTEASRLLYVPVFKYGDSTFDVPFIPDLVKFLFLIVSALLETILLPASGLFSYHQIARYPAKYNIGLNDEVSSIAKLPTLLTSLFGWQRRRWQAFSAYNHFYARGYRSQKKVMISEQLTDALLRNTTFLSLQPITTDGKCTNLDANVINLIPTLKDEADQPYPSGYFNQRYGLAVIVDTVQFACNLKTLMTVHMRPSSSPQTSTTLIPAFILAPAFITEWSSGGFTVKSLLRALSTSLSNIIGHLTVMTIMDALGMVVFSNYLLLTTFILMVLGLFLSVTGFIGPYLVLVSLMMGLFIASAFHVLLWLVGGSPSCALVRLLAMHYLLPSNPGSYAYSCNPSYWSSSVPSPSISPQSVSLKTPDGTTLYLTPSSYYASNLGGGYQIQKGSTRPPGEKSPTPFLSQMSTPGQKNILVKLSTVQLKTRYKVDISQSSLKSSSQPRWLAPTLLHSSSLPLNQRISTLFLTSLSTLTTAISRTSPMTLVCRYIGMADDECSTLTSPVVTDHMGQSFLIPYSLSSGAILNMRERSSGTVSYLYDTVTRRARGVYYYAQKLLSYTPVLSRLQSSPISPVQPLDLHSNVNSLLISTPLFPNWLPELRKHAGTQSPSMSVLRRKISNFLSTLRPGIHKVYLEPSKTLELCSDSLEPVEGTSLGLATSLCVPLTSKTIYSEVYMSELLSLGSTRSKQLCKHRTNDTSNWRATVLCTKISEAIFNAKSTGVHLELRVGSSNDTYSTTMKFLPGTILPVTTWTKSMLLQKVVSASLSPVWRLTKSFIRTIIWLLDVPDIDNYIDRFFIMCYRTVVNYFNAFVEITTFSQKIMISTLTIGLLTLTIAWFEIPIFALFSLVVVYVIAALQLLCLVIMTQLKTCLILAAILYNVYFLHPVLFEWFSLTTRIEEHWV